MAGRKQTLTKALIEKLCFHIAEGIPNKYACALVAISEKTFYNYTTQAEQINLDLENKVKKVKDLTVREQLLIQFLQSIAHAKAKFIAHHVKNIATQSAKNMMGSQWLLSKADHSNFGKVETVINQKMPDLIEFDDEN